MTSARGLVALPRPAPARAPDASWCAEAAPGSGRRCPGPATASRQDNPACALIVFAQILTCDFWNVSIVDYDLFSTKFPLMSHGQRRDCTARHGDRRPARWQVGHSLSPESGRRRPNTDGGSGTGSQGLTAADGQGGPKARLPELQGPERSVTVTEQGAFGASGFSPSWSKIIGARKCRERSMRVRDGDPAWPRGRGFGAAGSRGLAAAEVRPRPSPCHSRVGTLRPPCGRPHVSHVSRYKQRLHRR